MLISIVMFFTAFFSVIGGLTTTAYEKSKRTPSSSLRVMNLISHGMASISALAGAILCVLLMLSLSWAWVLPTLILGIVSFYWTYLKHTDSLRYVMAS